MEIATPCQDETERLEALYSLELLDTPAEERFDRWTRMAQRYFNVPISLICLVDVDRQWFKSRQGIDAAETERSISFCGHAIQSDELFVINNADEDPRFHDNPLVSGPPYIRFYAACPLRAPNGQRVGTLCLIDEKPRGFTEKDSQLLKELGLLVEQELTQQPRKPKYALHLNGYTKLLNRLRSTIRPLGSRLGASIMSLTFFVMLMSLAGTVEKQREAGLRTEQERAVMAELVGLRGKLESLLNAKLYLVQGLSGLVHANPSIDEHDFLHYANEIGSKISGVRSLQLAPQGIVTYVWPLESNRAAIGHNLLDDPERHAAAQQAITSRKLWLAGPLTLIQGGDALIGRLPIFLHPDDSPENFWGFASILVDVEATFREAGIYQFGEHYRLALRGIDASGKHGDVFFGDPALFQQSSIRTDVTLPAGSWEIAAIPKQGWTSQRKINATIWLSIVLTTSLLSVLLYALLRLPSNLRRAASTSSSALARSESRFKDAVEALPDGFVIYDERGRITATNQQLRRLYPASQGGVQLGKHFEDFIRQSAEAGQYQLSEDSEHFVQDILSRHNQPQASYELALADGRWIHVVESEMRDGGKVGFHRDITELKKQHKSLIDAKQHAEQANQAKTQFLATVSHELRTPLNGVLGLLAMLSDDNSLTESQHNYAVTAHDSARQLLSILNEILDISKLEAGKLSLDSENFILADTITSAINLQRTNIEQKGLSLHVEIDPQLQIPVRGDSGRIRQVLLNLLSNACKFTNQGDIYLDAKCQKRHDNAIDITIAVRDTGIGFDTQHIDKLFEPFTQLDNNANRQFSGSGLGLAICKRLMNMMDGSIRAESTLGQGACFSLELTLATGKNRDADQAMPSLPTTTMPTPTELGWPQIRVLMAEDGVTNQLVIKAMLKDSGYTVDIAHNGIEAVQAVKNFHYDVILMDVYMPTMDGLCATRKIRQLPGGDIPIIALTANAMEGDKERFLAAGMNEFLAKPVTKQDLLATLFRILQPRFAK